MDLLLLLIPFVAAFSAGPLTRVAQESAVAVSLLTAAFLTLGLSWVALAAATAQGAGTERVLWQLWFESGTLTVDVVLSADLTTRAVVAVLATLFALAQLQCWTVVTPKKLQKTNESLRVRAMVGLHLLTGALVFLSAAGSAVTLFAAALIAALATGLAVDFNLRSQLAGRVASKALLVILAGALCLGLVAAMIYARFDADALSVVFAAFEGSPALSPGWALAIAAMALAFGAALPFLPWTLYTATAPSPVTAAVQGLLPIAGVLVLLRLGPLAEDLGAVGLAAAGFAALTALFGASASLFKGELRKALGLAAMAPVGVALAVALLGHAHAALAVVLAHGALVMLLWFAYSAVARGLAEDTDLRHMGGLAAHFQGPHLAALVGTLGATGLGLPFAVAGIPVALPGYGAQVAGLAAVEGASPGLFAALSVALFLNALALWRIYLRVFRGAEKSRNARLDPEQTSEPRVSRSVEAVLIVLILGAMPIAALVHPQKDAGPVGLADYVPLIASVGAFVVSWLSLIALPALGSGASRMTAPVSALAVDLWGVPRLYLSALERPALAIGANVGRGGARWGLSAWTERAAAALLPALTRHASAARRAKAFPIVLGALVAAALVLTLVTMAGG
ncbi:MAG: hypothetical protein AAF092_09190 [Pseudomonadota bacterium]